MRIVPSPPQLPSGFLYGIFNPGAFAHRALLHSRIRARKDEPVSPSNRRHPALLSRSAFAGCRFPAEVITVAVRWYLRYGLSYRDIDELLAERGIEVDHVTLAHT